MHHWADHGIVGRAVLLDYYGFCELNGTPYDPYTYHTFTFNDLANCGKAQGIDIRPESQGGDIKPGDILLVRGGFVDAYNKKSPEERREGALRKHGIGIDDGQRWAGVGQEEKNVDWLHDCYFSAVGSDMPSFEAWPSHEKHFLHEYLLACWGVPIGEMFDLEGLARVCREESRWWVFVTSAPANVHGGVSSHGNLIAIV
jgi:kynurenine formamidase